MTEFEALVEAYWRRARPRASALAKKVMENECNRQLPVRRHEGLKHREANGKFKKFVERREGR